MAFQDSHMMATPAIGQRTIARTPKSTAAFQATDFQSVSSIVSLTLFAFMSTYSERRYLTVSCEEAHKKSHLCVHPVFSLCPDHRTRTVDDLVYNLVPAVRRQTVHEDVVVVCVGK